MTRLLSQLGLLAGLLVLAAVPRTSLAADAPRVRAIVIESAAFGEEVSLSGTLFAEREARLSPRVDGLVLDVAVDAGDEVEAGDVLLRLDPAVGRQALARVQAEANEARAAVDEAERLLSEARRLGERQVIARTQVDMREAEVLRAQAALASAQANHREQAELVARHELPAPFSGVIVARMAESGEWVQRGTPVLTLVATDRVRLDLQAPQERFIDLTDDTRIVVLPDALPGIELEGRIQARVPVSDATARTFLLRVVVEDPEGRLLPGTSARARILLPADDTAVGVPRDALLRQPDGGFNLFVLETDDDGETVARQRSVQVVRDRGEMVAVSTGVAVGERVVVRGNEALDDGDRVDVVED